jgi:hypothetical protein
MFRNHRIPLTIVLSVLAITGADIGKANAQNGRFWKSVEQRFGPELRGLAEWLRPKWVQLEEEVKEEAANLQRKLGEATADRAPSQPGAAALVRLQQSAAVEHRMQLVGSWLEDGRSQIVADLQKGADLSESDVAAIFVKNMRAAAGKSASPLIEIDPVALKIRFTSSVDIHRIRIKASDIDLKPGLKKAGSACLGCMAMIEKDAKARASAPDAAASAGISGEIMKCVDSAFELLKDEIRTALKPEPDPGLVARAAERGD